MAEFAAIPLFTDAWLADTGHLTRAERGLYMDLLILIWRSPGCRVPNDHEWIGRKLRVDENERDTLSQTISEFCFRDGGYIMQRRLLEEFSYVAGKRKLQSERAKSRWSKEKDLCRGIADVGIAPSPSPSPSPVLSKEEDTPPLVSPQGGRTTPKPAKEKSNGTRGARLAKDWRPSEQDICFARAEGLTDDRTEREAERFRDYWWAQPGQRGVKRDWRATWRNWVRRCKDGFGGNGVAKPERTQESDRRAILAGLGLTAERRG